MAAVVTKGQPGSKALFKDTYLLHKLHSLSGVVPIGAFMIFHLVANSYSLRGEVEFNTVVKTIGYLPFVLVVELAGIFVPILFHAIYGFFIIAESQGPGGNVAHYGYTRNWLYVLQRWTGVIAFAYICFHVWSTTGHRWGYELSGQGGHEEGFRSIAYQAMAYRFAGIGYTLVYFVGIASAAFHLGNGLFNFCIRWGITIGQQAQKVAAGVGILIFLGLTALGGWTALNFHNLGTNYPIAPGQTINLREKYASLDELVKTTDAPAEAVPGAKPAPESTPAATDASPAPRPSTTM